MNMRCNIFCILVYFLRKSVGAILFQISLVLVLVLVEQIELRHLLQRCKWRITARRFLWARFHLVVVNEPHVNDGRFVELVVDLSNGFRDQLLIQLKRLLDLLTFYKFLKCHIDLCLGLNLNLTDWALVSQSLLFVNLIFFLLDLLSFLIARWPLAALNGRARGS